MTLPFRPRLLVCLLTSALAACGGGDSGSFGQPESASKPQPENTQNNNTPPVQSGATSVQQGAKASIGRVEARQVLVRTLTDPKLRLVNGKGFWLWAEIYGKTAGVPSSQLQLTVNGTPLSLIGPATLPLAPSSVPDVDVRYSVFIPGSLVGPNMQLQLKAADALLSSRPTVGARTQLTLRILPLQFGSSRVAQLPGKGLEDWRLQMLNRFPLTSNTLTFNAQPTYKSAKLTSPPTSGADWTTLLNELADLRRNQGSSALYYGLVPQDNAGMVGLGDVGADGSLAESAAGWDNPKDFTQDVLRTFLHEIGHNLSLNHAPCQAGNPDPAYPYANGGLGGSVIFDTWAMKLVDAAGYTEETRNPSTPDSPLDWKWFTSDGSGYFYWIKPTKHTDVMGYCDGNWLSDYHYDKMQAFLERNYSSGAARVKLDAQQMVWLLAGRVQGDNIDLQPAHWLRGAPASADLAQGDWRARITLRSGEVIERRFALSYTSSPLLGGRFNLSLALHGEPSQLELWRGEQLRLRQAIAAAGAADGLSWQELGGQLHVQWDAQQWPELRVSHRVPGNERSVIALSTHGGKAQLPLPALAQGGEWEFSLANGLSSKLRIEKRY